jgi:two-component system, OmpR family, response regulator
MKPKKRILIIDDEAGFTRLLKLNLEATGDYEVREENRGPNGPGAAREFKPDLILLDVMMPGMDGGAVAERVQADRSLKSVPIVFLTAAAKQEEVTAHAGRIGGFPFIAKPISLSKVIEVIEQHLLRE